MNWLDIRLWIILFFIIRLYGIAHPPIEIAHNWRQTCGNMVARNFLEVDANIMYPRVDMAGEKSGITGTEFPLFNYLIFLTAKVFGYDHWFGRLINLIVSSVGTYFFYLILRQVFEERLAFISTLILLGSIWLAYSRKIMPDTFSASLIFMSLYYALGYFQSHSNKKLFAFFILGTLGLLCKIPSLVILSVLLIPLMDGNIPYKAKYRVIFSGTVMIGIVSAWYFYWVPHLVETYGYWHYYMGTSFGNGIIELYSDWGRVLEKFYFDALKFIGFGVFLFGVILMLKKREKLLTYILVITSVCLLIFMIKAGRNFPIHSYYIIPFVPVMALVAGYAIARIENQKFQIALVALILIEGVGNQQHDFRLKESETYKMELEHIADRVSEIDDLIAINCGQNPQQIYLAHRKGWNISNEDIEKDGFLEDLMERGCKYLFLNKVDNNTDLHLDLDEVFTNDYYKVYKFHTNPKH